MIWILRFAVIAMALYTLPARAASEADIAAVKKIYEQAAKAFIAGDLKKMMEVIDPKFVHYDEKGKRVSYAEIKAQAKDFHSKIRKRSLTYTINNIQSKNGKLLVQIDEEAHFEIVSTLFLVENWTAYIMKTSSIEIWEKRGDSWKLTENRRLKPEDMQRADGLTLDSLGGQGGAVGKAVKYIQLGACLKQCADALMDCATELKDAGANVMCITRQASCAKGCR
jgi:uncharacterized protein YukE